jgi:hypothetical protein
VIVTVIVTVVVTVVVTLLVALLYVLFVVCCVVVLCLPLPACRVMRVQGLRDQGQGAGMLDGNPGLRGAVPLHPIAQGWGPGI